MRDSAQILGRVVLGRYRIVRRLAQGGMGVVYLARIEGAEGFARPAVIKRMLPEFTADDEFVRMFVREARILADLRHPGIVSVLDFAAESDAYLMALDYVDGFSLGQWLRFLRRSQGRFEPILAIHMMARVLDALHYVHTRTDSDGRPLKIVHRDISPSNILVDRDARVRILDFGIARTAREVTKGREGEISIKGKLAYLAPELLQGSAPTVASDVYACGVTLHELLTGGNEFRDKDPTETMRRVLLNRLTPIEQIFDDIPLGLDEVIRRGTSPEPKDRYADAGAMADALDEIIRGLDREAESRLRSAVDRDFARIPEVLGIMPLPELERAWRDAEWPDDVATDPPPRNSEQPTRVEGPAGAQPSLPERAPSGGRWLVGLLAIVAIAGLALGGYAVYQSQRSDNGTQLVVIDQRSLEGDPEPGADAGVEPPAAPDAGAPIGVGVDPPPAPDPPSGRRRGAPRDEALELSRRFNRRHRELRACFRQHAAESEGRPQLSVHFQTDAAGRVTSANLLPEAVAATPLGRCLLGVARSTEFGAQPRALSFRIPITVTGAEN